MKKRKIGLLIIICLLTTQMAVSAVAEQAHLSNLVVTNTKDHLLVYFTVEDCFTAEMDRAIESGLDTTFTFIVKLFEKRKFWWDRKITDLEVKHSIKYDNLKQIYEVRLSEQDNKTITVSDFDEAKKLMSEVVSLRVTPLHSLSQGRRYQLRMMAELDKIRLPLYLHYVFFFLSLWNFETDWHTIEFKY